MTKKILHLIAFMAGSFMMHAQEQSGSTVSDHPRNQKIKQYILAGFNIGAATPLSLPNNVRQINGWWPQLSPSVGYEFVYRLSDHWGIGAALKLEYKGMGIKDSVQYLHTIITVDNGNGQTGSFEGDFTGTNKTIVNNAYLTLPINVVYEPNEKWRYKMGIYVAHLLSGNFSGTVSNGYIRNGNSLGEKVLIDESKFNFDKAERNFDFGLQGGAERVIGGKLSVNANLNFGLEPLFPADFKGVGFKMYNIFLTLGVAYRI
jgi:hypothetical protein